MTPQLSNTRTLLPWYSIEFLNSYAATLFCAGCYDYADEVLGVPPATRLWMSSAWGLAYIFIALAAGRLSEKLGPRRLLGTMIAGCIATTLFGLLAIQFPSQWVLLAIMLPYNVTSSMIWPALESAITRTAAPMKLSTRMALYNLSWGSAGFVAFFTRGALEKIDWSLIFIAPAIASLLSLLIFALSAPPSSLIHADHVPDDTDDEHDVSSPASKQRAKTLLIMAWIGNTLAYIAVNVLIPVQLRLANESGIYNLAFIAYITSIWSFTRFLGFGIVWKWSGWHYKIRWLLGAQIALALSFCLLLTHFHPVTLITMQILFGLSTALVYSCSLYYAMHVSDGHGGHAGIHEALIGLGIAIGPAVGALAAGSDFSPDAIRRIGFGVTLTMAIGITAMTLIALKKPKPLPSPPLET